MLMKILGELIMTTIPDLKVTHPRFSNSYMGNLERFIYSGAASKDSRWFYKKLAEGFTGELHLERIEFLLKFKEKLELYLVMGYSVVTVKGYITCLGNFFKYIDNENLPSCMVDYESNFLKYAEYLFFISNMDKPKKSKETVYGEIHCLSTILGEVLDIPKNLALYLRTRIFYTRKLKGGVSLRSEKQNLEETFRMCGFVLALIESLTVDKILGELPIKIPVIDKNIPSGFILLRIGSRQDVTNYRAATSKPLRDEILKTNIEEERASSLSSIKSMSRWPLVNLRVLSEFILFISQTGMNVAQASKIKRERFTYNGSSEKYQVRLYKPRRQGEVQFEIYKSYKPYLDRYIDFLNHFLPECDLLFPKLTNGGHLGNGPMKNYTLLRNVLLKYNIPWVTPSSLRNTRINWLLRRSGDDDISADMAQHTKEVLKSVYEKPSQQRAMVEITRFWNEHDPLGKASLKVSILGSICNGEPEPIDDISSGMVKPDCVYPSGCLWCKHHRDVDNEDYIWSLFSMRYLKTLELSHSTNRDDVPAEKVIERLDQKIRFYSESGGERKKWVDECSLRVSEGNFHPAWDIIISVMGEL